MKKKLSFLILVLSCNILQAQDILDNNPPSLRWYQVNTEHFRVLFPKGFDMQAQRMANTLELLHGAESKTLGVSPRKISVLLQNQSSISNGFVSMFPRRSEFYTMPPQDYNFLGANDWLNLLASHEYRHIVQFQHARRGLTKAVFYVFGNPTFAAVAQMAAPPWFWEGDAVATETAFTPSGRGKIPNFGLVFKTNLLEGRTFHYNKQHLRSYKHFIPDHYVLGYHMTGYLRKKTSDPEIWGKITRRAWNVPFIPFAFSNAIKKETGMTVSALYRDLAVNLKQEWTQEIAALKISPFEKINDRSSNAYTDYLYPQPQPDGSVIVMKKGIGDIERFVRLKDGEEERVFTPGIVNESGMLSAHSDAILWNEHGYDPRWRARNYSLVKLYQTKTKEKRVIGGRRERLSGAALSPDGSKIVAIRTKTDYTNSVVVFELFTGKEIFEYADHDGDFFAMPRWSPDGTKIITLRMTPKGKTISSIDIETNEVTDLLPLAKENVGHPVMHEKYLLFNSPVSGIDNVYALDLSTNKRYQVTTSKYGAYNPAVSSDGKFIYYNDQSKDGMDVVRVPFSPSSWQTFNEPLKVAPIAAALVEQEHHQHILDSVPDDILPTRRYSKVTGLFNPYSWGLNVSNDLSQVIFGLSSKDLLSTTSITAGYVYDLNERTGLIRAGVSYQGLYPILDFSVETGDRENNRNAFGNKIKTTWNETTVEGGIRVPLLLTRSKYLQELSLGTAVGLTRSTNYLNSVYEDGKLIYQGRSRIAIVNDSLRFIYKDDLNNGDLTYNRLSVSYVHVMKTSYRDFLYRWGQTFAGEIYHTPFQGDFEGRLWAVRSTLYFPGIAKQHYFYVRGAYQESRQGIETNLYTFRNRIPKPRGYSYPTDGKFVSLSANYAFPIWYPDIALGPVLNIQRVKMNAFVDYGEGTGQQFYYHETEPRIYYSLTDAKYLSTGAEITFDFNVMRLLQKFELGFRATHINANTYQNSGMVFEFLVGNIGF